MAARVLHHTRAQRVLAGRRLTGDVAALRDIVTDLARLPDTNRYLAGMMSGLDVRYPMPGGDDHPLVCARMPDIDLVVSGVATRLSALMHTGRSLLLDLTGNDHLTDALVGNESVIDVCRATTNADIDATTVLLRPDGHICWLTLALQRRDPAGTGLHAAIKQWFEPGVTKQRHADSRNRSSSRSWRTEMIGSRRLRDHSRPGSDTKIRYGSARCASRQGGH